MKFDTQTKKNMLSSKVTKAGMINRFQDGRRRHVGNSSACYKMGNYHRTLMKIGGSLRQKKQQKLNVKNDIFFKKAALYEREVIKKQKIFIRRQKLTYS
jgi:hypothetical protein